MATIKTSGIVIRKTNIGEADRILTLLTYDRGKVRIIAKGVRKPRAKLAGFTDMFSYNEFEMAEGRNLDIVTSANTVERFVYDGMPLEVVGVMYYFCELVDKLVEETQEVGGVFELVRDVFHYLKNHTDINSTVVVKSYFEMKLLLLMGFVPELQKSVLSGEALTDTKELKFSVNLGGVIQGVDLSKDEFARDVDINTVKFMRLLKKYPIYDVAKVTMPENIVKESSLLLSDFVEHVMDVRSKSLNVLAEL